MSKEYTIHHYHCLQSVCGQKHCSRCKLICPHSPVLLSFTGHSFLHACSHMDIQCFHYKMSLFFWKAKHFFFHAAPIFLFFKEVACMVNDSCGNFMVGVIRGHNIINLTDLCDLDEPHTFILFVINRCSNCYKNKKGCLSSMSTKFHGYSWFCIK